MEAEKTKLMIAIQRQRVIEQEAETSRKQKIIHAQAEAEVSKINKMKEINEEESKQKIEDIKNQIYMERMKAESDAQFYMQNKEIEANLKKLTPSYLQYMTTLALVNNTKFYFGESIPKYLSSNMLDEDYFKDIKKR